MMQKLLPFFLCLVVLQACAPSSAVTTQATPDTITKLSYFAPISYIQVVRKGNLSTPSDSLSRLSVTLLDSLLAKKQAVGPLSSPLVPTDEATRANVQQEIDQLAYHMASAKSAQDVALPATLDAVMEVRNERYALAFVATGFSRVKGNYSGQFFKALGIGLLTLGMYIPDPVKASSTLHVLLLDATQNKVVGYQKSALRDRELTNPLVLEKQVNSIFASLLEQKK